MFAGIRPQFIRGPRSPRLAPFPAEELHPLFNNRNHLLPQLVQLLLQPIDLSVRSINLPLEQLFGRGRLGVGQV